MVIVLKLMLNTKVLARSLCNNTYNLISFNTIFIKTKLFGMNIKELVKNYIPFKSIKGIMPWWLKVGSKMVIYRLPIGDKFWKSIGFFQYDQMEVPEYAYRAFKNHFDRVTQAKQLEPGFTSLELGPGNSLFSALICRSHGGGDTYMIDVDNFAIENPQSYVAMADYLTQQGLAAPQIQSDCGCEASPKDSASAGRMPPVVFDDLPLSGLRHRSFTEIMADCGGVYLTSGLASLQTIESNSVDFVWSHAVLEHIRRAEFLEIMKETRRVISDDGVCSHTVDLKDHLDQSLNNLRFKENFWESKFVNDSGIYTNRIRCEEMLEIFREAGFEVREVEYDRWQQLPVPRNALDKQFQDLSDDELRISGFSVLLIPV